MLVLITGGSGSGKSAYAEDYITKLSKDYRKYYIATMQVYDEEGQERVCRHQKMRQGKGFITIEQSTDIHQVADKMEKNTTVENIALLECISNLVANEMFCAGQIRNCALVKKSIIGGIEELLKTIKDFIIVTNNVFEDGITYDETTTNYIRAMGEINQELAKIADKVIEVVVGIPIIVKEGR
ncbi:MAG: bifunctional adenosylcobinamide kinase/adenosylcobinamide-phosphate guanylyltransferase [Lachnospiraceae bacterium]|nr:bifunctional adenosylcobinamide kinase/adenosylcobinamide-phosphate guanylyltransferase [Lachnospiraceae bacterium]